MTHLIKQSMTRAIDTCLWLAAYVYSGIMKSRRTNPTGAVIIPADSLIGGFGDDIMVASLIDRLGETPTTIFCAKNNPSLSYLNSRKSILQVDGFYPRKYFDFISILKEKAILYVFGADILDGAYDKDATLIRFRIIKLAHRLGVKTTILAFSISNNIKPYARKELNNIRKITKLTLRDKSSFDRMQALFPDENLGLSCDIAFNCPTPPMSTIRDSQFIEWKNSQVSNSRKIIAICPNAIQASKLGTETYVSNFSAILDQFCNPNEYSFLFLYHDIRSQCTEGSDKEISKLIYQKFSKRTHCYFVDSIKNGVELKSYMIDSHFTVTGRMHFGISGITLGAPMFGVEYQNKFAGLQNLFEVPPMTSLIDYTKIPEEIDRAKIFLAHVEEFRNYTKKNLDSVVTLSTNYL